MGRPEAIVEKYLDSEIKKLGGFTEKWEGRNGNPDRIVFLPYGRVWFVEVKTLKQNLRPSQQRFSDKLSKMGANTTFVKGKHGVDLFIKDVR